MLRKILILDKDLSMCQKFSNLLRNNGYVTASTSCNKEALQLIKASDFDLILCDSELKNTYPVDFLLKIKTLKPAIPIISIGSTDNVQTAVELMKSGAFYFLLKPINVERLLDIVEEALNAKPNQPAEPKIPISSFSKPASKNETVKWSRYPYIKGKSAISRRLYKAIDLVAPTDYTVIIHGETGTGKESVARMIHDHSKRCKGPFLAVDCGSLSKELAASELFGHEKGAFTGALQSREGAFTLAHGGTLFLDEIGNLSYDVQLLLLRAIQERVIRKIGTTVEKPVDVRLIVASNEDLYEASLTRGFREDLYHRLNEFSVVVPPLRDRIEDLPLFVEGFVAHAAKRLDKSIQMPTEEAMQILKDYSWPGNIRELLNTIKKACLFTPNGYAIAAQYLPAEVQGQEGCEGALAGIATQMEGVSLPGAVVSPEGAVVSKVGGMAGRAAVTIDASSASLKDVAATAELNKILYTLRSVKYNTSQAAALLNIDRKTLYNKLKKINVT